MQTVNIDGTEYNLDSFNEEQKHLLNNALDIEQRIQKTHKTLSYLQICSNMFLTELKKTLTDKQNE